MVEGVLRTLPPEPSNLIGFSLGGYLLTEIARVEPSRIKSAMLMSNAGNRLPDVEKAQRQQALDWVLKVGYNGLPMKKARQMLWSEHPNQDELLDTIIAMDSALGEEVLIAQLKATLERRDNFEAISMSQAKWLVLAGLADQFVTGERLKQLSELKQVDVNVVAQSGHMLPLEQPKWVANKINGFFC
jgi:pimeloyl-ACP methyl ester carboxylesterase